MRKVVWVCSFWSSLYVRCCNSVHRRPMHDYRTVYERSWGPPVVILFLKARRELRMKYGSVMRLPGHYLSVKNIQNVALNQRNVLWVNSPTGCDLGGL